MDYVGDALRELAPAAEKAGVILGLENTISAGRTSGSWIGRSPAVKVYYDVGNSINQGFDVYKEIVWLGKAASASSTSRTTRTTWARARSTSAPWSLP